MLIKTFPSKQSYRYFPSHIPTIERLASYYIESQAYEKAIRFLEKAAAVQLVLTAALAPDFSHDSILPLPFALNPTDPTRLSGH